MAKEKMPDKMSDERFIDQNDLGTYENKYVTGLRREIDRLKAENARRQKNYDDRCGKAYAIEEQYKARIASLEAEKEAYASGCRSELEAKNKLQTKVIDLEAELKKKDKQLKQYERLPPVHIKIKNLRTDPPAELDTLSQEEFTNMMSCLFKGDYSKYFDQTPEAVEVAKKILAHKKPAEQKADGKQRCGTCIHLNDDDCGHADARPFPCEGYESDGSEKPKPEQKADDMMCNAQCEKCPDQGDCDYQLKKPKPEPSMKDMLDAQKYLSEPKGDDE